MTSDLLTVAELALYLRTERELIYREVRAGRIPGFKVGGNWRFHLSNINAWILAQESAHCITIHKPGKYRANGW